MCWKLDNFKFVNMIFSIGGGIITQYKYNEFFKLREGFYSDKIIVRG